MKKRTLALVAWLAAGCGIGLSGSGSLEIGADDGTVAPVPPPDQDAGVETDGGSTPEAAPPAEAGPCTSTSTACTSALPAGWTPIAFASNRAAGCPSGWTTDDLVTTPVTAAGACTCACQIAPNDPPTCSKGTVSTTVGTTNACGSTGTTYTFTGPNCTASPVTGAVAAYGKGAPIAITLGTCTPSVTKDASKLTTTAVRSCTPPAACVEDLCDGSSPSSFASCVAHDGDVACPAGPFATKTLTGPSATLTCGGCATCQNSGTCGPAKIHWYNDSACATELASRVIDNACNAVASGSSGVTVSYVKYDSAVQNPTCASTGTATTSAALDTPRTVCCR